MTVNLRTGETKFTDSYDSFLQYRQELQAVLRDVGRVLRTGPMRCAVLGDPIEHSLSPALHRAAYAALGLDWTYDAVRVPSGGLPPSWRGSTTGGGGCR